MLLIDSSVLIQFLRGNKTPQTRFFQSVEAEGTPFGIPAICAQEILQGAKDQREYNILLTYLSSQELVVPEQAIETHFGASRIFFDCRRRGLTVRSSVDCFIAQLALEREALLLHSDRDFATIAAVRPLKFPKVGK